MHAALLAQAGGGRFGGNIALRHAQQLKPDHKLAHRRRAQQRRVIMRVQVLGRVFLPIRRRLVKAHRIGEGDFKQVIVAGGHLAHDIRQPDTSAGVRSASEPACRCANQQDFERPDRPERDDCREMLVASHHPLAALPLGGNIVAQQAGAVRLQ